MVSVCSMDERTSYKLLWHSFLTLFSGCTEARHIKEASIKNKWETYSLLIGCQENMRAHSWSLMRHGRAEGNHMNFLTVSIIMTYNVSWVLKVHSLSWWFSFYIAVEEISCIRTMFKVVWQIISFPPPLSVLLATSQAHPMLHVIGGCWRRL